MFGKTREKEDNMWYVFVVVWIVGATFDIIDGDVTGFRFSAVMSMLCLCAGKLDAVLRELRGE